MDVTASVCMVVEKTTHCPLIHSEFVVHRIMINNDARTIHLVYMQGQESGGSSFETCSGVLYPRRRPRGVAINTLVALINWLGKPQFCFTCIALHSIQDKGRDVEASKRKAVVVVK